MAGPTALRQSGLAVPSAYAEPPERTLRVTVSSIQDARQVVAEQMLIAQAAKQLGCASITLDVESEIAQPLNEILLNAFATTKRQFRFRNKEDNSMFYQLYVKAGAVGPKLEQPILPSEVKTTTAVRRRRATPPAAPEAVSGNVK